MRAVQDVILQQTVSNNPVYQTLIEQTAQQKFFEYLSQRFDLAKEFTDTKQYDPTAAYNAGDRVYLNAPDYSASSTYALGVLAMAATGQLVSGNPTGQVYACSTAISAPEVFNPAHWTLLGNQWDLFYALYPFGIFDISHKLYNVGDSVWWKNHTYTALQKSIILGQFEKFQFFTTNRVPFQNVFPDDLINGAQFWKDNGPYVVPAGNLLTQNPSTYILLTQARDNIFLNGGTQLTVGGNSYTDASWAGWDFYIEQIGLGTLVPGVDFNYTWMAGSTPVVSATNPNLLATGFRMITRTFLNLQVFVTHFQPIMSQTAPLNPFATLTSQQIITTYFTKGDNRNQSILQHYIALVLYYLYRRIAPKNIPDERTAGYKEAMGWLTLAMKGDIVTGMAQVQPPKGLKVRSGSAVKQQNSW